MKTFNSTDPHNHRGKTDSWLTPLWIIEALGNNFDLDPCGFNHHKTAKEIWQLPKCGLENDWHGKVWLNPPYFKSVRLKFLAPCRANILFSAGGMNLGTVSCLSLECT